MKNSILENAPCWNYIRYEKEEHRFVIGIHAEYVSQIMSDQPYCASLKMVIQKKLREHGIGELCDKVSVDLYAEELGIDGNIQHEKENDGFVEYSVALPKVVTLGSMCSKCTGKGTYVSEFDGCRSEIECLYCSGHGRSLQYNWSELHKAGLSINFLLSVTERSPEKDTTSNIEQLATITFSAGRVQSHVGCTMSSFLVQTIFSKKYETESVRVMMEEKIKTSILDAYLHMDGLSQFSKDGIFVDLVRRFSVNCSGYRCGMYARRNEKALVVEAGDVRCHNVINGLHAFVLLAGLVTLLEEERKSLKDFVERMKSKMDPECLKYL